MKILIQSEKNDFKQETTVDNLVINNNTFSMVGWGINYSPKCFAPTEIIIRQDIFFKFKTKENAEEFYNWLIETNKEVFYSFFHNGE